MFMANEPAIAAMERIDALILTVRGQRVMLDSDLAVLYGVQTKRLLEQVRRNLERFPRDFAFQLNNQEVATMRSQFATTSRRTLRARPWVFTEHGAIMLASVLNSPVAIDASVRVVRAFIFLREQMIANKQLARKLAELEGRVDTHDEALKDLFEAIRQLLEPPAPDETRREMGFHIREQSPPYRIKRRR